MICYKFNNYDNNNVIVEIQKKSNGGEYNRVEKR